MGIFSFFMPEGESFFKRLRNISSRVHDAAEGGAEYALDLALQHTKDRFETDGANERAQKAYSGGWHWAFPAEYTMERRLVNQDPNQAMVDTGLMLRSIKAKLKKGANKFDATIYVDPAPRYSKPSGATISVAEVAQLLNDGFSFTSAFSGMQITVPPRPFMGLSKGTVDDMNANMVRRVARAFRL